MKKEHKDIALLELYSLKVSLYADIGWGIILAFLAIGVLLGKEAAVIGVFILCTVWTSLKVAKHAGDAPTTLRIVNAAIKKLKAEPEEEDNT